MRLSCAWKLTGTASAAGLAAILVAGLAPAAPPASAAPAAAGSPAAASTGVTVDIPPIAIAGIPGFSGVRGGSDVWGVRRL
jgi:hypothetical protein